MTAAELLPVDPAAFAASMGGPGFDDLHLELVDMFVREAAGLSDELAAAVGAADADTVRRIGHRLKGSAAAIAAQPTSLVSAAIEDEALTATRERLGELQQQLAGCIAAVQTWLTDRQG